MKTSRLVLAPAVAVALTGLAGAPALAATSSPTVPNGPLCTYDDAQSKADPQNDSAVPDAKTPQATVAEAQVSRDDIADKKEGIGFSGTGFTPDDKATVTVVGTDGTKYTPDTKLTVDEKGQVNGTYFFSTTQGAEVPLGDYTLFLTDLKTEKESSKVTFEVVAKDADKDDSGKGSTCERPIAPAPSTTAPAPSETAKPTETAEPTETAKPSPTKTEEPAPSTTAPAPTETAKPSPTESQKPTTAPKETPTQSPEPTETATETPTETPSQTPTDTPSESTTPAPTPSETKTGETTAPVSPGTDEKKPAAAAQSLIIDPTEISSEDFLNKGVKLGVTGAQPGEKITIVVEHAQGKVDRYTMTKDADSEGNATFGVQAKVKAVLGTYNVRVQAESFDKPQGGSFTVVTNGTSVSEGSGSGSGDNGGSAASGDLPRTGAEMTGLALGAGLLVVGAAAVVITRRRANAAADDPAEF